MNNKDIQIIPATKLDIPAMVELSHKKRKAYEQAQHQFWKYKEGAEASQEEWFAELLTDDRYIMLIASDHDKVIGFLIGQLITPPGVYDAGLTLMIDDFCVALTELWQTVGVALVSKIKEIGREKGAAQILVVSGDHDTVKNQFLEKTGLNVASRWYVGDIK